MNQVSEIGKTWFGGKNPSPPTFRRTSLPVNSYSSKHNHTALPSTSGINKQRSTVRLKICAQSFIFVIFLRFWSEHFRLKFRFFGRKPIFCRRFQHFEPIVAVPTKDPRPQKATRNSTLNPDLNQSKSNLNGKSRRPSLFTQTSQTKVRRSVTIRGPMGVGKTSICDVLCNPNLAEHVKTVSLIGRLVE